VGITEVLKRLPSLVRAMRHLVDEAQRRKPPLAILTDFPGFHLRLARKLRPRGIRNVYYICPQFWAWRPWRVKLVRRRFGEALCIFHFEEKFYADACVPVKFIGHPLVGNLNASLTRELFCRKYGLPNEGQIITVLPGSRRGEIAHHLPVLIEGLRAMRLRFPGPPQIVIAVAPGLDAARIEKDFPRDWHLRLISNDTYNALAAADLAIVSSGTATVETALLGKPMIVVYRLSPLTARLAKPLVRTKFFSMVNLIAGHAIVPELIQDDFTPRRLASEAESLLSGSRGANPRLSPMKRGREVVRTLVGPPGAVERAADEIARLLTAQSNAK